MSSKKRKKLRAMHPSPITSMQNLRRLLLGKGSKPGLSNSILDQVFGPDLPTSSTHEWLELLDDILSMYPQGYRFDYSKMQKFGFEITGLYREMITGKCIAGNRVLKIFVRDDNESPAGCNCHDSKGEYPCEHSYHFVHWLKTQIKNRNSQLAKRISNQDYDPNPPKLEEFKPDVLDMYRDQLRQVMSTLASSMSGEATEEAFPKIQEPEKGRIAWDFHIRNRELEVTCLQQTPKKKGYGWNKGRKVAIYRLGELEKILSPADQRIYQKTFASGNSFYFGYDRARTASAFDAAFELVGQPNALIAGRPAVIRRTQPLIQFRESETECWLSIGKRGARAILEGSRYLEYSPKAGTIGVAQLSPNQQKWLAAIIRLNKYPIALKYEFIEHARQLRKVLTVQLPEATDGKLVNENTTTTLIVRLNADGTMNYAWRVKLHNGQLVKAGDSPLIRADKMDGQVVQLRRSCSGELAKQRRLARFLKLPPSDTSGVVSNFDDVLKLLQKVRDLTSAAQQHTEQPRPLDTALGGGQTNTQPSVTQELFDVRQPLNTQDHALTEAKSPAKKPLPPLEVLWDEKSEKPVRILGVVTPQNLRVNIGKSRDWFQLSGECNFGDEQVDFSTLLRSLQNVDRDSIRGNYVKLGDQGWAKISDSLRTQLQRLNDSINEERKQFVFDASSAKVVNELLHYNIQVEATKAWAECLQRMENARLLNPVVPKNLNARLRDYQREGYCWMRRLAEWGVGGILADDMGLGKTLQALAVLLDRSQEGPALVIAPTSIGFNWVRETNRFAPDLKPHLYRETDREDFLVSVGAGDLVICSYGLVLRDAEKLSTVQWGTLILDEAQAVKNARSKTALAIAGINAKWKLALTGTPVENHLGELWSIFRAVAPGVFGGWEQFRKRYAAPIERDQDEDRRLALRDRLKPFVLRRTKAEVLKDLPPRTESNMLVELNPDEREAYDRVRLSVVGELDEIAKLDDIQDQRFRMLALLTRLRQLACSPRLVHADWPGRSSKLQFLADTVNELRSEGHRCLVFSQFVSHLELIRQMLDEEKISYQYIDGSTTPVQRQQRVDAFQAGEGDVFLISLKAGGTGLNLTAADYVIHMDPWWNPAVEDQATDRAHRIGQDKPVMVYRIISQGTIEEEILKLHDSKRDLVAGVLEGSHAAAKLSTHDLMALIRG